MKKVLPFLFLLGIGQPLWAQFKPPCPTDAEPPSENCESACIYCNFHSLQSTTANYAPETGPGFCGVGENDQWIGFVASQSSAIFTALPSNCVFGNGLQMALYKDCNTPPLACNTGLQGGGETAVSLSATALEEGETYYLRVDGYAGDLCDFTLSVNPPMIPPSSGFPPTEPIQGPTTVCPEATFTFSIPLFTGAGGYLWTAPTGALVNGESSPLMVLGTLGHQASIQFGDAGGQVCVTPANACAMANKVCKSVGLSTQSTTVLPTVTVCQEDVPYNLPWGQPVSTSGVYEINYGGMGACDSLVRQQVNVKSPIVKTLPLQTLCKGACFMVCDSAFCHSGQFTYTCKSYQGCDSTVHFALHVVEDLNVGQILTPEGKTITCLDSSITLNSATPGVHVWLNHYGQLIGTGNSIQATQPGFYSLQTTVSQAGASCSGTQKILIKKDTHMPAIQASGGTLDANHPTVTLHGFSTVPVIYHWTGPGGFSSYQQNPVVSQPGFYTLTITSPTSGCTNSKTVEVLMQ